MPAGSAGAPKPREARGSWIAAAVNALVISICPACTGEDSPPAHLLDGSTARHVPVELEAVGGPAVLTKSRLVPAAAVAGSLAGVCLREWARAAQPAADVVERVGVRTESVTIRAGSSLYGCDNGPGPRENDRRWCGMSFGTLYGGHLRDPRLDILCTAADGSPLAFVWVEPSRQARYVVVRQQGFAEVYGTTGRVPVRVAATERVDVEEARATVDLSEHDVRGRLIRRYVLDARVAG